MVNPSQYLLSRSKRKDLLYFKIQWELELKALNDLYYFNAKWKDDPLMCDRLNTTKEEMWQICLNTIPFIEVLEKDIGEVTHLIYMNDLAVVELKKSNKPFEGLNLSEHSLIQQSLF